MFDRLLPIVLASSPVLIVYLACAKLWIDRVWPVPLVLTTLGLVTFNATLAATNYLHSVYKPSAPLPPWQDQHVLNFGLLLLLAPVEMVVGLVAAGRGVTPGWLILLLEIASLPLLVLGVLDCAAV